MSREPVGVGLKYKQAKRRLHYKRDSMRRHTLNCYIRPMCGFWWRLCPPKAQRTPGRVSGWAEHLQRAPSRHRLALAPRSDTRATKPTYHTKSSSPRNLLIFSSVLCFDPTRLVSHVKRGAASHALGPPCKSGGGAAKPPPTAGHRATNSRCSKVGRVRPVEGCVTPRYVV